MEKKLLLICCTSFISLFAWGQGSPICIGKSLTYHSPSLDQTRQIFIRLPQGYDTAGISYPVHFLLDGELTFHAYTALTEIMVDSDVLEDGIIVGIPNIDRDSDFDPMRNGYKFLDFITRELVPYVDDNYRTNGRRILCGYSLSATYTIFTLINAPDTFDGYLAGSPYWLNIFSDTDLATLSHHSQKHLILYTSMGQEDHQHQLEAFRIFCAKLDDANVPHLSFKYVTIPNRNHTDSFLINWQDGLSYVSKHLESEN